MSGKLPAFQFYPGDWRKDPGIQACSLAARGLWVEMLCLMHESEQRGYLVLAGRAITPDQLARQTGGSADEVRALLAELESAGVFSRDEGGVIYSRRMGRDEHIRRVRSEAGKLGAVHGHKGGRPRKDDAEKRQKGQTERQNNPPGVSEGVTVSVCDDRGQAPNPSAVSSEGGDNGKKRQTKRQTERQNIPSPGGQNNPPSSSSSEVFSCSEPASPASEPDVPRPEGEPERTEPPVMSFPCVGTGGKEWHLTAAKVAEWAEAYPHLDIRAELRKALQWLIDNPTKRKTAKGMTRFLGSWLSRAQDRGGATRQPAAPEPPRIKRAADNSLVSDQDLYEPAPLGG